MILVWNEVFSFSFISSLGSIISSVFHLNHQHTHLETKSLDLTSPTAEESPNYWHGIVLVQYLLLNFPSRHSSSLVSMRVHLEKQNRIIYLFIYLFIYWSIVALQYYVNLYCTAKWISYTYTYILSFGGGYLF